MGFFGFTQKQLSSHSVLLLMQGPQLSHVHPHSTNDYGFLCDNVCVCMHTPARAVTLSLPARFLPLRNRLHVF